MDFVRSLRPTTVSPRLLIESVCSASGGMGNKNINSPFARDTHARLTFQAHSVSPACACLSGEGRTSTGPVSKTR